MTDVYATMLSRLYHFFQHSPNILKRLTTFATSPQDTNDAIDYFLGHWGIDDAEGALLDKVGQLLGVYRPPAQEDPANIFTVYRIGEVVDLDGSQGFKDTSDSHTTIGGYLTTKTGLISQSDPGAEASDAYYRFLIKQKASSYRSKATNENLFLYLIAFGGRCLIDDDTALSIEFDPVTYYDLDEWAKSYITTRGFKPGGVSIKFTDNLRHGDSI